MVTLCTRDVLLWVLLTLTSQDTVEGKTKANIFDGGPIRIEDYGRPPTTLTIPLYDCSVSHRPKTGVANAFQVFLHKEWYTQFCQDGLVWNQTLCRCEFPNGDRYVAHCRDYRAKGVQPTGRYEQFVNGHWIVRDCSLAVAGLVWDQRVCQCVWGPDSKGMITGQGITPCDLMLNMTFEDGVKDLAKGSFVEVVKGSPVQMYTLKKKESKEGKKAAYFNDTALHVWYFADNDLGTSLRVEFRFKATKDLDQPDKYQILISNGCSISGFSYTPPTLAIGYRAFDQSYLLAFETSSTRKAVVCTRKMGAYDWHTVSLIYEDGTLLLRVDEHPCIVSRDFSGPVQKTSCPLTIGADPLERQAVYKGYLDNLLLARYCRRFIDTDPTDFGARHKGSIPVRVPFAINQLRHEKGTTTTERRDFIKKTVASKHQEIKSTKYRPGLSALLNTESGNSNKSEELKSLHENSTETDAIKNNSDTSVKSTIYRNDLHNGGYSENEFHSYENTVRHTTSRRNSENRIKDRGHGSSRKVYESEYDFEDSDKMTRPESEISSDGKKEKRYDLHGSFEKKDDINDDFQNTRGLGNTETKGYKVGNEEINSRNRVHSETRKGPDNNVNEPTSTNKEKENYPQNAENAQVDEFETWEKTVGFRTDAGKTEAGDDIFEFLERVNIDDNADNSGKRGGYSSTLQEKRHSEGNNRGDYMQSSPRNDDVYENGNRYLEINGGNQSSGKRDQTSYENDFQKRIKTVQKYDNNERKLTAKENKDERIYYDRIGDNNAQKRNSYDNDHIHIGGFQNKQDSSYDLQDYMYRRRDGQFTLSEENKTKEEISKPQGTEDTYNRVTDTVKSSSSLENTASDVISSSDTPVRKPENRHTQEDFSLTHTTRGATRKTAVSGGTMWYDSHDSSHPRQRHLVDIDLTGGSAFVMDRSNRRKLAFQASRSNLVKGRRRSGHKKKKNWYDIVDSSETTKSFSQDRNSQDGQNARPLFDQVRRNQEDTTITETSRTIKTETTGFSPRPSNARIPDKDYGNDLGQRNPDQGRQDENQKTLPPKITSHDQVRTGVQFSKSEGSVESDYSKVYDQSDNSRPEYESSNVNKRNTIELSSNKNRHINNTNKQTDTSLHQPQQFVSDTLRNSNAEDDKNKPGMTLKYFAGLYDSTELHTPYNGNEYEKSHTDLIPHRHLDMIVDVTKIRSSK